MNAYRTCIISILAAILLNACGKQAGGSMPNESDALLVVKERVAGTNIEVISVKKTDGRLNENKSEYDMEVVVSMDCKGKGTIFCTSGVNNDKSMIYFTKMESGWRGKWLEGNRDGS